MKAYRVRELADLVAGTVEGDGERFITGIAPVDRAGPDQITFVVNERYAEKLDPGRVGACLVPLSGPRYEGLGAFIRVDNPEMALTEVLDLFHPGLEPEPAVHPTAQMGRGVKLGEGVWIGPFVTIDDGATIGARSHIGPHSHVGADAVIGEDCRIADSCSVLRAVRMGGRVRLHSGVRVGVDGFGYALGPEGLKRIPHVGGCVIEDDVEIGANSTVDRGSLGDTLIGAGTKIDNLVHIGHNVTIGMNCVIVAQVGVAGSSRIGDGVQLGGQAGIAGHLSIGSGARVAAQAGVIGNVPAGAEYSGYPARPHREALRASAQASRMTELRRRVAELERRLDRQEAEVE